MISKQLQQLVILFINMTLPHPLGCHMLRNESTQHCVNSFVAATRRTFCFETHLGTNSTLKLWAWLCRCDSDNFVDEIFHFDRNGRTQILLRLNVTAFKSCFSVFKSY